MPPDGPRQGLELRECRAPERSTTAAPEPLGQFLRPTCYGGRLRLAGCLPVSCLTAPDFTRFVCARSVASFFRPETHARPLFGRANKLNSGGFQRTPHLPERV